MEERRDVRTALRAETQFQLARSLLFSEDSNKNGIASYKFN